MHIGLKGTDTRNLAVQIDGPHTHLWVGTGMADPNKPGKGCYRATAFRGRHPLAGAVGRLDGWNLLGRGLPGRQRLRRHPERRDPDQLDVNAATPQWETPSVNCGLPLRDRTRFEPVAVRHRSQLPGASRQECGVCTAEPVP